ncbi:GGDEF domain-containing protein [Methylobacterium sp. WL30]|uniref:GGDEF domain-containing protein n=1 Tax=Methylobacterium sp. WL93 TaxID=2603892 RepID=UPI0011CBBB5B|nr:diguanylate cyclase [Methylobacterium sp. WL93]TXN40817.1 GGDEF domain-containing protein [Methylobacterium sp. WL93]TXN50727.1 GGDEF domain-containing protein [Methylobacterium sp. WL119]TXN67833.1 GGDEF domain-containing protein [Methylobacterium sp. WL30]
MARSAVKSPDALASLLHRPFYRLTFPSAIESAFQTAGHESRRRESTLATCIGLIIYWALYYADCLLLSDVVSTAAIIRFGIVTPIGFGVIWFSYRTQSRRSREIVQSASMIMTVLSFTAMELASSMPGRTYHNFGFVEVIVYAAIVQRLPFKYALTSIIAITFVHLATVLQMHEVELQIRLAANSLVAAAGAFILVASYSAERWDRQRFIMTTLDAVRVAELDHLSRCDALTGLSNRRSLDDFLSQDMTGPVAVILLDVDAFKRYNDHYGHQQGDMCLRLVAQAVQSAAGNASFVARYGGEEIVILLQQANDDRAWRLAEAVRVAVQDLALPHVASGTSSVVTVSVGCAIGSSYQDQGLKRLIRQADEALYRAKSTGRNRVATFGESPAALALVS